jgi:peptide/nickel transport system ATP-binding protein
LFISHNLAVIGYLADKTAVIYVGFLMEVSEQGDLFTPPHHPYTEALISAIPEIVPGKRSTPVSLEGEIPDPADLPGGCPFHTRCHRYIGEICATTSPPWQVDASTNKQIFCHIPLQELSASQEQSLAQGNDR